MGLSNGAKKARNYSSIVVRNQGGGNDKAGLPYQVGRSGPSGRAIRTGTMQLKALQMTVSPAIQYSRGIGGQTTHYFHVPRT